MVKMFLLAIMTLAVCNGRRHFTATGQPARPMCTQCLCPMCAPIVLGNGMHAALICMHGKGGGEISAHFAHVIHAVLLRTRAKLFLNERLCQAQFRFKG